MYNDQNIQLLDKSLLALEKAAKQRRVPVADLINTICSEWLLKQPLEIKGIHIYPEIHLLGISPEERASRLDTIAYGGCVYNEYGEVCLDHDDDDPEDYDIYCTAEELERVRKNREIRRTSITAEEIYTIDNLHDKDLLDFMASFSPEKKKLVFHIHSKNRSVQVLAQERDADNKRLINTIEERDAFCTNKKIVILDTANPSDAGALFYCSCPQIQRMDKPQVLEWFGDIKQIVFVEHLMLKFNVISVEPLISFTGHVDVLIGVDTKEVQKGLYPTIAALLCCDV